MAWFPIRRTGDTIYLEYYERRKCHLPGDLFMTLNTLTAPALADPVSIGVFLFHPAEQSTPAGTSTFWPSTGPEAGTSSCSALACSLLKSGAAEAPPTRREARRTDRSGRLAGPAGNWRPLVTAARK